MINVTFITNNGKRVSAPENSNLLRVSLRGKGGIPFKCGAGLCGTCKCRIEQGLEHTDAVKEKERKHLSDDDLANGFRMACQTFINGDVGVSWQPKPAAKPAVEAAKSFSAATDGAFRTLTEEWRQRLLDIGPIWAEDIATHREMVIDAYTPVLEKVPREGIEASCELAYGPHAKHRLDVYRRAGLADAAVVLFVHGGAFVRGAKDVNAEIYGNFTRYFARHGCVAVNMEYRLAPESVYPGGAEDVARAVNWIRAHAREFGGNPERVILVGHSAGAAHAAAYVCDPAARPAAGPGVAGLVLISGRLRADARPDNPNAHGVRAYYGADESLYERRSAVSCAECVDVPLFVAIAEYENPYLDAYSAEFIHRVGMARKRVPRFVQMRGHNHTSIVAHFDSGEDSLGRELLDFIARPA